MINHYNHLHLPGSSCGQTRPHSVKTVCSFAHIKYEVAHVWSNSQFVLKKTRHKNLFSGLWRPQQFPFSPWHPPSFIHKLNVQPPLALQGFLRHTFLVICRMQLASASNNWRAECITNLRDFLGRFCFCFFLQRSWIFACRLRLNRKTLPYFFRWLVFYFQEITYAKMQIFPGGILSKESFCFARQ